MLDGHLIVDTYGTHKHRRVKAWLRRRPRFRPHFISTSSSWLNLVERWFRELTDKTHPSWQLRERARVDSGD
jgi:hypothetical protein